MTAAEVRLVGGADGLGCAGAVDAVDVIADQAIGFTRRQK